MKDDSMNKMLLVVYGVDRTVPILTAICSEVTVSTPPNSFRTIDFCLAHEDKKMTITNFTDYDIIGLGNIAVNEIISFAVNMKKMAEPKRKD